MASGGRRRRRRGFVSCNNLISSSHSVKAGGGRRRSERRKHNHHRGRSSSNDSGAEGKKCVGETPKGRQEGRGSGRLWWKAGRNSPEWNPPSQERWCWEKKERLRAISGNKKGLLAGCMVFGCFRASYNGRRGGCRGEEEAHQDRDCVRFFHGANLACQKSFSLTVLPIIIRSDFDDTYVSLFVLITIALPRGPWLTPSNHTRLTSFARSVL